MIESTQKVMHCYEFHYSHNNIYSMLWKSKHEKGMNKSMPNR